MKRFIKAIPVVGDIATTLNRKLGKSDHFENSADYWERRYASGGNSGAGSYSKFAEFKAEFLNEFVRERSVRTVIEFGCGDGNQLSLAQYPEYKGYDVSRVAVELCRKRFASDATKTFGLISEYKDEAADLALSLDVIYHLVEDAVFEAYMRMLFAASTRHVIVYSSDADVSESVPHVRQRKFSKWVQENISNWALVDRIPNRYPYRGDGTKGSFADFFVYQAT